MKYNLKNRPRVVSSQDVWVEAAWKWFEGFEKELREMKEDMHEYFESAVESTIEEILGE